MSPASLAVPMRTRSDRELGLNDCRAFVASVSRSLYEDQRLRARATGLSAGTGECAFGRSLATCSVTGRERAFVVGLRSWVLVCAVRSRRQEFSYSAC